MLPNLRDLHHSTWCWLTTVFLNGRGLSNLMPNYSNLPIYQQFGIEMIGWQWILLGLWSWSIILIFISIDNLLHFGLILSLVEFSWGLTVFVVVISIQCSDKGWSQIFEEVELELCGHGWGSSFKGQKQFL
jgi:hypothetical protein